jgi:2'-5' RNA ligase
MADDAHGQPRPARLFFALWPDDEVRRRIAVHRQAQGRPVPPENWHVTLVFLGSVWPEQRERVEAAANAVRTPPFRFRLDSFGHWRRAGIAWLGSSEAPPALLGLQKQLVAAARSAGIDVETRRYQPHLTLARNAPAAPVSSIEPIEWEVADFSLVESETPATGARYTVRRRWPLQAGAGVGAADPDME